MQKNQFLFFIAVLIAIPGVAQQSISIGDTQVKTNAVLYLKGNGSQGLIIPVVSSNGSFGEQGMMVYNSTNKKIYFHNGTTWVESGGTAVEVDGIIGNEVTQVNITRGGLELTGSGTTASPLSVGLIQGTVDGQILKWNNTTKKWELGTDNTGTAPTVDNTSIGINGSSQLEVKNLGISTTKIQDGAVTSSKIADGTIAAADLNAMGASNGQVLKYNGTNWAAGTDNIGLSTTLNAGNILVGNASNVATSVNLSGDGTLSNTGALTINNNVITDAKVATGISGSKINPNFGAQNIATTGTLSVGGATTFNTRSYTWPNVVAGANTYLRNDGTGILSWQTVASTTDQTAQTGILTGNGTTITGLASTAASQYLRRNAANTAYEFAALTAVDIPSLDAGKITSGTFPLTRITGAGAATRAILGSDNNTVSWVTGGADQLLGTDGAGALQFFNKSSFAFTINNVLPKGSASGLIASSIVDNGSFVNVGNDNAILRIEDNVDNAFNSSYLELGYNNGSFQRTGWVGKPGSGDYLEIGSPAQIDFNTNFNTRMVLTSAGQLGIGTSGPTRYLDVDSNGSAYGISHVDSGIRTSTYNGTLSGGGVGGSIGTETNHPFYIYVANSGEKATFLPNGNVGIGTNAPAVRFHVDAGAAGGEIVRFQGSSNPYLSFYEGANYRGFIQAFGGAMYLGTVGGGGDIVLYSNGAQGLIVNTSRLVGLSRTPTTNRLEVNGEASKSVAGSWVANSDRRIKTNIQDIENASATLMKLRPVKFRYSDYWLSKNPDIKDKYYYNFIAQEFQQVFPEAVKGSGEYIEGDPTEILQIDTYNAEIVTIKAVQELISRVEQLEKENQQLRQEKSNLEIELRAEITAIQNALNMEAKASSKK